MNFSFLFLLEALLAAVARLPVNLYIAFTSLIIGGIIGMVIAAVRYFEVPVAATILKWYVTIFRGIPVILMIVAVYVFSAEYFNRAMESLGINYTFRDLDKSVIAIFVLVILISVGLSEAFRGALSTVRRNQYDAAYSVGHTKMQTLWRIILPQAIPVALPALCNTTVGIIKSISLATAIAVVDVLNGALIAANSNYRYFEAYIAASLVYWVMAVIVERVFYLLERHFNGKLKEMP